MINIIIAGVFCLAGASFVLGFYWRQSSWRLRLAFLSMVCFQCFVLISQLWKAVA